MALIFGFFGSYSTWVSFVAQDVIMQILLVVDVANNLGKTLG